MTTEPTLPLEASEITPRYTGALLEAAYGSWGPGEQRGGKDPVH